MYAHNTMNHGNIKVSERSQSQQITHCFWFRLYEMIQNRQIYRAENSLAVAAVKPWEYAKTAEL